MKKLFFVLTLAVFSVMSSWAQKYAFIDTEYILDNIPSYHAAQEELDQTSLKYQKELEGMRENLEKMYKDFQAEKVLLSEDMRRKREDVIITSEKEYKQLQQKYFGPNGDLFRKRQSLIKPIQDDIFNAISEIGENGGYAVIFDKASGTTLIFTNPRYDLSDQVLERLGYKN